MAIDAGVYYDETRLSPNSDFLSQDAKKQLEQQVLKQQQQLADMEAAQRARPNMPGWQDMREVKGGGKWGKPKQYGLLTGDYRLQDAMAGQRVGLGLLQQEATRQGPSQWRQLEEARQADLLNRQGAGQLAQAQGGLAMRGGLRGGAGERMAAQIAQQNLLGRQGTARDLALADEQRRMQAMQQLPGAELAESQYQTGISQYNIDKALQEQFQKRASDLAKYQEDMRAWASKETAAATPSSGGKK